MTYESMVSFSTTFSLLLFFTMFLGVLYWVFRPGSKKRFDQDAQIPLREDD